MVTAIHSQKSSEERMFPLEHKPAIRASVRWLVKNTETEFPLSDFAERWLLQTWGASGH